MIIKKIPKIRTSKVGVIVPDGGTPDSVDGVLTLGTGLGIGLGEGEGEAEGLAEADGVDSKDGKSDSPAAITKNCLTTWRVSPFSSI